MMTLVGARAKCLAGGSPHERRVRPHLVEQAGSCRTQQWNPGPKACAASDVGCRSAGELVRQRSLRTTATPWTASAARDELPSCGYAPTLHTGELDFFLVADSQ